MRKTVILCLLALLVSSCSFDDSHNLVSATVSVTGTSKNITVDDTQGSSATDFVYCMEPCFSSSSVTNPTAGTSSGTSGAFSGTEWTELVISNNTGSLGLCTQGSWNIKVRGLNKDGIVIYEGQVSSVYITDNTNVNIALSRVFGTLDSSGTAGSSKANVSISVNTVKVAESGTCAKYRIKKADDMSWGEEVVMTSDTSYTAIGREAFKADFSIESGKYLIKISYYNNNSVVGSQVAAFMAFAKNTVTISGNIDGAMFVSQGVTVVMQDELTASIEENNCVFTCNASGPSGGSYSYMWFVNGILQESTDSSLTFTQTQKGLYDISCIVVWTCGSDSAITSESYSFTVS